MQLCADADGLVGIGEVGLEGARLARSQLDRGQRNLGGAQGPPRGIGEDNPEYFIRPSDGKLFRCIARRYEKVRGRCLRVGWRHTFEGILRFGVPGVTRESLSAKFHVDMYKVPIGPIEELVAALVEE